MGEVYLAEDSRLGRQIALKLLPASYQYDPDRRDRFMREARAASALRSPHAAAIYDIGEHDGRSFIAMEYIEGETLSQRLQRSPLPVPEAAENAAQIADALQDAHSLGIIHRDIKSSNVIVTARGIVKVLDFGLAKIIDASDSGGPGTTRLDRPQRARRFDRTINLGRATTAGLVVGTVPYMSPEQSLGNDLDHRTDIFSLGVVMYEMLTGRLPFSGNSTAELIDQIVHDEPVALARFNYSVPEDVDRIVRRCMAKDSGERYQSAREVLADLRALKLDSGVRLVAAKGSHRPRSRKKTTRKSIDSLAILPFVSAAAESEAEYLADGITESIIKNLSQLPRLRVMAGSTVFRFKGRDIDAKSAAAEFGVRAVLTGRVVLRGDSLVIRTELVDGHDGSQLWGEHYNRKLSDIFGVEEEISREISEKLRLRVSREQKKKLAIRHTEKTEAYQAYLKGRFYWSKRTEDAIMKGIESFQQAIDLDPGYALAYTGLADSYNMLGSYCSLSPRDAYPRAKAAARKALEINDSLAEAHASLGFVTLAYDWDWDYADLIFKRAIELDPAYANARLWHSLFLMVMSRREEAFAEMERAKELEPLSLPIKTSAGWLFQLNHRYDEAIQTFSAALEMDPQFVLARRRKAQTLIDMGVFQEAITELERVLPVWRDSETLASLGHAYAAAGDRPEAEQILSEVEELSKQRYVPSFFFAKIFAALGEKDRAIDLLERAYEERFGLLCYLSLDPSFDALRSDPRFQRLIKRVLPG
jgi:serine/threonine protein kinase/tetratricopeptide (TPR) repeat protein